MKKLLLISAMICLYCLLGHPAIAQNVDNYMEQGGALWVVGGELEIESGATFTVDGIDVPVTRTASGTVLSGQTAIAVAMTGVTTASLCVTSLNEVTTNAVYVRAVVPTADTATVTVSADPGASNADLTVICTD